MQGSYSGLIGSCRVLHAQQSYCYPLSGHCMHNNPIAVHYLATARTLKAKFHALDAKGCNIHLISGVTIGFTAVYRHTDRMFAYYFIYLFQLQTSYGMYIPLGSGYITAIFPVFAVALFWLATYIYNCWIHVLYFCLCNLCRSNGTTEFPIFDSRKPVLGADMTR